MVQGWYVPISIGAEREKKMKWLIFCPYCYRFILSRGKKRHICRRKKYE